MWEISRGTCWSQGDAGECMWFLVRGRLRVSVRQAGRRGARGRRDWAQASAWARWRCCPRRLGAATVRAVRDSELLRLCPGRRSTGWSSPARRPCSGSRAPSSVVCSGRWEPGPGAMAERTIALVAAGPDVPTRRIREVARRRTLEASTRTAVLDGTAEARQAVADAGSDPRGAWCWCATPRQRPGRAVPAPGGRRGGGGASPTGDVRPGPLEQEAWESARAARRRLPPRAAPGGGAHRRGTEAWLAARPGVHHHHVRPGRAADHARLARLLSGQRRRARPVRRGRTRVRAHRGHQGAA